MGHESGAGPGPEAAGQLPSNLHVQSFVFCGPPCLQPHSGMVVLGGGHLGGSGLRLS